MVTLTRMQEYARKMQTAATSDEILLNCGIAEPITKAIDQYTMTEAEK